MDSEPEWRRSEDAEYWHAAAVKAEKCYRLKDHPPTGDFFIER